MFPDGEGGNVCGSDGGEARGGEPQVRGGLVEKRDQMVEIPSGREGRERSRSAESRRTALMGGHVWRWGWGREAQQRGRRVWERRSCAGRRGVEKCRGGERGERKRVI